MSTYSQGLQRIEVIVRKEGGNATVGANENASDNVSSSGADPRGAEARAQARQKRIILTNTTHLLALARQEALLWGNYAIQGIGQKYGDQSLQEHIEREVEIAKDVTGFASNISRGVVFGAWGGPVGAVIGGLIGAISSASSTGVKYLQRQREFNYKMFKENSSLAYRRARASISLTNGRLR